MNGLFVIAPAPSAFCGWNKGIFLELITLDIVHRHIIFVRRRFVRAGNKEYLPDFEKFRELFYFLNATHSLTGK